MSVRTVKHELEAKLTSRTGGSFSKPSGKLERKSYGDIGERLKISLRNLKVSHNAIAVVTADGVEIAQVPDRLEFAVKPPSGAGLNHGSGYCHVELTSGTLCG